MLEQDIIYISVYANRALHCIYVQLPINYNDRATVDMIIKLHNNSKLSRMCMSFIHLAVIIIFGLFGDRTNIYQLIIQIGGYLIVIELIHCYLWIYVYTDRTLFDIGYYIGSGISWVLPSVCLWYLLSDLGCGYSMIIEPLSHYTYNIIPTSLLLQCFY